MEQEVYGKEVASIICQLTGWLDALDIQNDAGQSFACFSLLLQINANDGFFGGIARSKVAIAGAGFCAKLCTAVCKQSVRATQRKTALPI